MSRSDRILAWLVVVGTALLLAVRLIRSAITHTLLFFQSNEDSPSWVTLLLAVMATFYATQLWRHYRSQPKAEGGAL